MKIQRLRYYRPHRLNPAFNQSNRIVTIETDAGITGNWRGRLRDTMSLPAVAAAQAGADAQRQPLVSWRPGRAFRTAGKCAQCAAMLIGENRSGVEHLWPPMYDVVGGPTRQHIECYSTGTGSGGSSFHLGWGGQ